MKKTASILVSLLLIVLVFAAKAEAREGSINLSSSDVSCEGVSIWRDGSYRVSGRCDGLVYPYETQYDRYTLWAQLTNGEVVRVDNVDRGYFEGNVFGAFNSLFITAETSTSPRKPSAKQIAKGSVTAFSFDKSENVADPSATPAPVASAKPNGMTVQNNTATSAATSNVGSVIGTILKSLLIIVAVIVVITIAASLIFRRRGSVSA